MKKRKLILLLAIIFACLVIIGIRARQNANKNPTAEETAVSSEDGLSETMGVEVSESMKDESDMNAQYGDYLTSHPVDFFVNETELTATLSSGTATLVFGTGESENQYLSLTIDDAATEVYATADGFYVHTMPDDAWDYQAASLEAGEELIQDVFDQIIDSLYLSNVIALIDHTPELRYQKTVSIQGVEFDVFAAVLTGDETPVSEMTDEEYEAYIKQKEEENQKLLEELEQNEDALFQVEEDKIGSVLFYFNSETGKLKYISAYYGADSVATVILREQSQVQIPALPDQLSESAENTTTEQIKQLFSSMMEAGFLEAGFVEGS